MTLDDLRGFGLSLKSVYETFRISVPTVTDAARGVLTIEQCDARLDEWSRRLLEGAGARLTVDGREHARTPCVVMSNHQSHFDVPSLFQAWPGRLRMVAKTELFRVPVFSQAMTAAGFIEIDRSNRERAIASLRVARERLAQGTSVWIAPEGTRSRTGELGPFKKGGFVLAQEAEVPIVPVVVEGTRRLLPAHGVSVRPGARVHVRVLPAVPVPAGDLTSATRDELMTTVRAALQRGLLEVRALLAAEGAAR